MESRITDEDREQIRKFLGVPKYRRRPEDLLPSEGADADTANGEGADGTPAHEELPHDDGRRTGNRSG